MGQPIVHFDIIGHDPDLLREFYGRLFGWSFAPQEDSLYEFVGDYGFVEPTMSRDGVGIPGGVGGGPGFESRTHFYVGVPDVDAAMDAAKELGGSHVSGPWTDPQRGLTVGLVADPEGHVIGLANAM